MRGKRNKRQQQATRCKPKASSFKLSNISHFAWKKVTLSLFLVSLMIAFITSYFWVQNPQNLTIKSVEVTGDLKVLNEDTLQPIIEPYSKTNLYLLDTRKLEKEIESNPWVHSASMTKVWPDKLIITIYEQKPVAYWGKKSMLAENGEIIRASLDKENQKKFEMENLPMLYSPNDKGRNMATGFLKIKKWMGDFPLKMVEFKEDTRGSWQVKLGNGMTVKIGRDNQEKRLKRFMVGYQQSLVNIIDKISVVDLRYTNGFSVKWKKGLSADRVFKG